MAKAHEFGSITIASGSEFGATSGTTTIVGQPSGDYMFKNDGTFTHNNGTLTISRSSSSGSKYMKAGAGDLKHLIIDETNTSGQSVVPLVGVLNVAGDLTVTDGMLRAYGGTGAIDVDGDVLISSGGTLDLETTQLAAGGPTAEFGSLTIASGGVYEATPLTTTITGKESGACFANSGTFTHNNGKVSFTKSGGTWTTITNSGGQSFYDVNVDSSTGTGIYTNDPLTILNNFTLVRGTFIANDDGSHDGDITVHGLTSIGGGANATKLENDGRTLQLASVTVLSNGTIDVAEGTNNFGGIRNVGGTIS